MSFKKKLKIEVKIKTKTKMFQQKCNYQQHWSN